MHWIWSFDSQKKIIKIVACIVYSAQFLQTATGERDFPHFPPYSDPCSSIAWQDRPTWAGRTGHDDTDSSLLEDPRRADWTASDGAKERGNVGSRFFVIDLN